MKKFIWLPLWLLALQGCQNNCDHCHIVDESYVHKYGFEVPQEEWSERGQHGQKITTMTNGVTCTENFSFGQHDGETTYSYPYSTTIQKVDRFNQGQLIERETRSMTGVPLTKTEFRGDNLNKVTYWYETGTPRAVEELEGDTIVNGEYYTLSGQLESKVVNHEGERIVRGRQGTLSSKDIIQGGQTVERIIYYPNGNPKEIIPIVNGQIEGTKRSFLPAGEPESIEVWDNGKQNGLTVIFQNGEKFAEIPYYNGIKHGVEKRYRDGKELFQEITWSSGQERGTRTFSTVR